MHLRRAARPRRRSSCTSFWQVNRRRRAAVLAAAGAAAVGALPMPARGAIVIDAPTTPTALFRLAPFVDGGGPDAPIEPEDTKFVSGNAPSFVVPTRAVPVFQTGRRGTATARSGGSTDTSFSLVNDALTFHSAASFTDDASFVEGAAPFGGGVATGSGDLQYRLTMSLSDRPYVYSYSWRSDSLMSGVLNDSQVQATLNFSGASAFSTTGLPRINGVSDLHAQQAGSNTLQTSGAGVLDPRGELTLSLRLATRSGAGPSTSVGTSHTEGSYDLKLGLAPGSRWINPAGGAFHTADNWSPNFIPGAGEAAIYDLPGTYTVGLDRSVTNAAAHFHGNGTNVTLDLNGNNYNVDELAVGGADGDNVHLRMQDSGGIAVASASGPGRVAAAPPPINLFRASSMHIVGNTTVDLIAPTSSGESEIGRGARVNADGAAARWDADQLMVGADGAGTLALTNGAALTGRFLGVGQFGKTSGTGAVGTVTASGAGTSIGSNTIVVGIQATGELDVLNGANVEADHVTAGASLNFASGTITVDAGQTTATLTSHQSLTIGDSGTGHLIVQNGGGVVADDALTVGAFGGGNGDVTLSGGFIQVENLSVGVLGTGTVKVNQGLLAVTLSGNGGAVIGPQGAVTIDGGNFLDFNKLQVDGRMEVDSTGRAVVGQDSTSFGRGKLFVAPGGTLSGTGTLAARLVLAGGTSPFSGGRVSPGHSPGTLTVAGDFEQQPGGVLDVQIAGTAPGQFDVLAIAGDVAAGIVGNATIGGDLALEFLDGFAPHTGDRFDFLTATGTLTGQFQHVDVQGLAPGFQFDLRNENGHYELVALNDGVAVPEPGVAALLLFAGLATLRRRPFTNTSNGRNRRSGSRRGNSRCEA